MQDILLFMQNHWELSFGLLAVLALLIILEFIKQRQLGKNINPTDAVRLMNHENAQVIDVRNSDAFANGHIIGAISFPLKDLEEKNKKIEKFKANPIILVCGTGTESERAADILNKKGYNAQVLRGGLRSWKEADMPLVKG